MTAAEAARRRAIQDVSTACGWHDVVHTRMLADRTARLLEAGETWGSILARLNTPARIDDGDMSWME